MYRERLEQLWAMANRFRMLNDDSYTPRPCTVGDFNPVAA